MESLSVALGSRSYPIHIGAGLLDQRALYAAHLRGSAAIVSNTVVAPLYVARVRTALEASGARVTEVIVEDGEQAKGWATVSSVQSRAPIRAATAPMTSTPRRRWWALRVPRPTLRTAVLR